MSGNGFENRFDKTTPNAWQDERNREEPKFALPPFLKRFCESCRRHVDVNRKPGTISKHKKGWKCAECRAKNEL
jgi:hypothetical protein